MPLFLPQNPLIIDRIKSKLTMAFRCQATWSQRGMAEAKENGLWTQTFLG